MLFQLTTLSLVGEIYEFYNISILKEEGGDKMKKLFQKAMSLSACTLVLVLSIYAAGHVDPVTSTKEQGPTLKEGIAITLHSDYPPGDIRDLD